MLGHFKKEMPFYSTFVTLLALLLLLGLRSMHLHSSSELADKVTATKVLDKAASPLLSQNY